MPHRAAAYIRSLEEEIETIDRQIADMNSRRAHLSAMREGALQAANLIHGNAVTEIIKRSDGPTTSVRDERVVDGGRVDWGRVFHEVLHAAGDKAAFTLDDVEGMARKLGYDPTRYNVRVRVSTMKKAGSIDHTGESTYKFTSKGRQKFTTP